jgi:hypothetical protein
LFVADASGAGFPLAWDAWADAAFAQLIADPVGVVAAVGQQSVRPVLAVAATRP